MANEKEANAARRMFGSELMKKGAHAIGVERGKDHGKSGYVVVAHVEGARDRNIPATVSLPTDKGEVEVPVVQKRSEAFKPE